jgi:hypothetical protein
MSLNRIHNEPLTIAEYAILNESGDQARNYTHALGLFELADRLGVEGVWVRQFHLRRGGMRGGLPSSSTDSEVRKAVYLADLERLTSALGGKPLDDAGSTLNPPTAGLASRVWEATLTERSAGEAGEGGNGVLVGTTQTVPAEVTAHAYYAGLDRYTAMHGNRAPRVGLATLIYPAKDRETALRQARAGIAEQTRAIAEGAVR